MLLPLAFLSIVAVLAWRQPVVGLALAAGGYLLRRALFPEMEASDPEDKILGVMLPAVVFVSIALRLRVWRFHIRYVPTAVDYSLAGLGVVLLAGILYAPDPLRAAVISARYWFLGISYYFAMRLVLSYQNTMDSIQTYLKTIWVIALLLGILALMNFDYTARFPLTIGSANRIPFSLLIGVALLINIYWFLTAKLNGLINGVLLLCSVAGLLYAIIAINTLGPVVSLLIAVSLMLPLLMWFDGSRGLMIRLVLLSLVMAGTLTIMANLQFNHLDRLSDQMVKVISDEKGSTVSKRLSAYQTAARLAVEHPLLGVGTGGFTAHHYLAYPHNIILEVASENGLIGLMMLLSLVLSAIYFGKVALLKSKKERSTTAVLLVGLVLLVFVEAQFSFALWMHKHLYIFLALLVGLVKDGDLRLDKYPVRHDYAESMSPDINYQDHREGSLNR